MHPKVFVDKNSPLHRMFGCLLWHCGNSSLSLWNNLGRVIRLRKWETTDSIEERHSSNEWIQILQSIEERNERLPCPDRCPTSIYNLLLSCWALNSKDRPHFHQISAHLTSSRPKQYRVHRDHKQLNQLTLLRGDTISVFDSSAEKALWKGQNHRTQQVGVFPRLCLSTSTSNEKISWPVQGSFIHTGHRHGTGQGRSWGKIDSIDEWVSSSLHFHLSFFLSLYPRTILNNPIVSSVDRNENVQSNNPRRLSLSKRGSICSSCVQSSSNECFSI